MPTMRAVFCSIGCRRRAAKVAMETWSSWLAEVGRLSTLAGCASDLFSEASAAAVTCAIMKPRVQARARREERRQARDRRCRSAARCAARRWRRSRRRRAPASRQASATGSPWKLPPESRSAVAFAPAKTSGLSVTALASRTSTCAAWRTVEAGAVDLRHAAQAVGVLHRRRLRDALADRAAGEQRAKRARRQSIWPGWRRTAWMRGSNGPSLPRAASSVSAPATCAAATALGARTARQRERGQDLGAVDEREAFLGGERERRRPAARSASRARQAHGRRRATSPSPISAQRQVRERRQVARGADRALRRDDRHAGRR